MVGVLWSTGGWQHATYASGEVKNPRRTLPLAMIIGTAAVTVIYLLVNVAYMFLMTPAEIAASPRVAADAVSRVLGTAGGIGDLARHLRLDVRRRRHLHADGAADLLRDGDRRPVLPRVAEVHPRFRTPAFAIVAQSLWAVVLILFWGTFENLISYVVFTDWIFFGLAAAPACSCSAAACPDAERASRVPLYPWAPLFFVAMSAWFVAVTLIERPAQAWAGLAFLAPGRAGLLLLEPSEAGDRRAHER